MVALILNLIFIGMCLHGLIGSFRKEQYGWSVTFALMLGLLVSMSFN